MSTSMLRRLCSRAPRTSTMPLRCERRVSWEPGDAWLGWSRGSMALLEDMCVSKARRAGQSASDSDHLFGCGPEAKRLNCCFAEPIFPQERGIDGGLGPHRFRGISELDIASILY